MPTPLLTATATTGPPWTSTQLVALAVLAFLGWRLLAIWVFPYAPCWHCKGTGKHRAGRYWRPCSWCEGTGRRLRLGRRVWDWTRSTDTTRRR